MKKFALVASLVFASTTQAFAGDFYAVGSVGRASLNINKGDLDSALTSAGVTGLVSSLDKSAVAYKLQAGYQLTQNIAIEAGYVSLGEAKYRANFAGGSATADFKASGINIALLGLLPINDAFSAFAKLGTIHGKVEENFSATGGGSSASASASATKWKANWGAGVTYNFSKPVGLRLEYEQYRKLGDANTTGEGNVNLLSLGIQFRF